MVPLVFIADGASLHLCYVLAGAVGLFAEDMRRAWVDDGDEWGGLGCWGGHYERGAKGDGDGEGA